MSHNQQSFSPRDEENGNNEEVDEINNNTNNDDDILSKLMVSTMVDVEDRTWPGMNKEGGIARVMDVDKIQRTVSVQYIIGRRKEKQIELKFIRLAPEYEVGVRPQDQEEGGGCCGGGGGSVYGNNNNNDASHQQQSHHNRPPQQQAKKNLRDRSMLLGRCNRCGSLRTDCGSCDDWLFFPTTTTVYAATTAPKKKKKKNSNKNDKKKRTNSNLFDLSSSEEEESDEWIQKNKIELQERKKKRERQEKQYREYQQGLQEEHMRSKEAVAMARQRAQQTTTTTTTSSKQQLNRSIESSAGPDLFRSLSDSSDDDEVVNWALGNRKGKGRFSRLLQKKTCTDPGTASSPLPPATSNNKRSITNRVNSRRPGKKSDKKGKSQTTRSSTSLSNRSVLETLPTQSGKDSSDDDDDDKSSSSEQDKPTARNRHKDKENRDAKYGKKSTSASAADNDGLPLNDDENSSSSSSSSSGADDDAKQADENMSKYLTMDIDDEEEDDDNNNNDNTTTLSGSRDDEDDDVSTALMPTDQSVEKYLNSERPPPGDELGDFVQPEGDQAARNLPDDILDRAANVPLVQLPAFIDAEIKQLEGELLPKAKLRVAQLGRRANTWKGEAQQQRTGGGDGGNDHNAKTLLQELISSCKQAHEDITKNLIRNGTDQCISALNHFEHKYKRERGQLNQQEKKALSRQIDCSMERENKVNSLGRGEVTELLKKTRSLQKDLEGILEHYFGAERSGNHSDRSESENYMAGKSDTEDSNQGVDPDDPASPLHSATGTLRKWDRHRHASRKRDPLSEAQAQTKSKGKDNSINKKKALSHRSSSKVSREPSSLQREPTIRGGKENKRSDGESNAARPAKRRRKRQQDDSYTRAADHVDNHDIGIAAFNDEESSLTEPPRRERGTRKRSEAAVARGVLSIEEGGGGGIPSLEELLPTETNHWNGNDSSEHYRHQSRSSFEERQMRFLRVNGLEHPSTLEELNDVEVGHQGTQQSQKARRDFQLGRQAATSEENSNLGNLLYASLDSADLFGCLQQNLQTVTSSHSNPSPGFSRQESNPVTSDEDLAKRSQSLATFYKSNDPAFVSELKAFTGNAIDGSESSQRSPTMRCLGAVLKILQTHSKVTLQEALTRSGNSFHSHIALLTETVRMLARGDGSQLQSQDGTIFKVFSSNQSLFISAVVLQLVDSLYSLFHPSAWGNPFEQESDQSNQANRKSKLVVLNALVPLRDALASATNLTDEVCTIIMTCMECQTWRLATSNNSEKHAFISAVDPNQWSHLLLTGESLKPQKFDCRLSSFKECLPRCEAEALWSILAFVATGAKSQSSQVKSTSDAPIRLMAKILVRGVLCQKKGIEPAERLARPLLICDAQIDACRKELGFFLTLFLQSGVVNNIPKNDDICRTVIERAMRLQCEAYDASEKYPKLHHTETDNRKFKQIWKGFDFNPGESEELSNTAILADEMFGQPLLLPSSSLLHHCLRFFFAWVRAVPPKKYARLNRLLSVMRKALFEGLIDKANLLEASSSNGGSCDPAELDPFQSAFNVVPAGQTAKPQRGIFLREAAAYLHLVANISIRSRADAVERTSIVKMQSFIDTAKQVWEVLADDTMKSRQGNLSQRGSLYKGGEYRLCASAKAVTFSFLASLGVPVWNSESCRISDSTAQMENETLSDDSLVFLMKALVSCLDCHVDIGGSNVTMATLCIFIAIAYRRACQLFVSDHSASGYANYASAIKALGKASTGITSNTFKRCFCAVTAGRSTSDEESSFRSLLAAIRGASLLSGLVNEHSKFTSDGDGGTNARATCPEQETHGPTCPEQGAVTSENDDDVWGGIDDDVFASIDLDNLCGNQQYQATIATNSEEPESLFAIITKSIIASKPSRRFSIENKPTGEWNPSSGGMQLLAEHSSLIFDCLAVMTQTGEDPALSVFDHLRTTDVHDKADKTYTEELRQHASVSLCGLVKLLPGVSGTVLKNKETVMLSLLDALLDMEAAMNTLKKLPSCNFLRIRAKSGGYGKKEEKKRLKALKEQKSTPEAELWKFCRNFGVALMKKGNKELAEVFCCHEARATSGDHDEGSSNREMPQYSMEYECFKRIKMVAGLVEVASTEDDNQIDQLCFCIVVRSATSLLAISKEWIWTQSSADGKSEESSFKIAKLTELFCCCGVVQIATLCCILPLARRRQLLNIESLIRSYFIAILRRDQDSIAATLRKMTELSQSGSQCSSFTSADALPSVGSYLLRQSVIRGSRPLFLYLARQRDDNQNNNLLGALVSVGSEIEEADPITSVKNESSSFIANALSPESSGQTVLSGDLQQSSQSPLQDKVNEFMLSRSCSSQTERQNLWELRHRTLREHLLHRLWRNQTTKQVDALTRTVQFVSNIMKAGCDDAFKLDEDNKQISLLSLRDLARGLLSSLRAHLSSPYISDEFVSAIFVLAKSFAASSLSCGSNLQEDASITNTTVARWSQSNGNETGDPHEGNIASYVWHVLLWTKSVAEIVKNQRDEASHLVEDLRNTLKKGEEKWSPLKEREEEVLRKLHSRLFPDSNKTPRFTNVYSKGRNASGDPPEVQLQTWCPGTPTKRSAANFLKKVNPSVLLR